MFSCRVLEGTLPDERLVWYHRDVAFRNSDKEEANSNQDFELNVDTGFCCIFVTTSEKMAVVLGTDAMITKPRMNRLQFGRQTELTG